MSVTATRSPSSQPVGRPTCALRRDYECEVTPVNRTTLPLAVRVGMAAGAGYLLTRLFYLRWHESPYYDARLVSREDQIWQEMLYILFVPLLIGCVLQLFGGERNSIFVTAAGAAAACAYVAARQIFLMNWDINSEWYWAQATRAFSWLFGAGMILPWFAGRIRLRPSTAP